MKAIFKTYFLGAALLGAAFFGTACSTTMNHEESDQPSATAPKPVASQSYHSVVWQWEYTESADGKTIKPAIPERYTVSLKPDGTAAFLVDCNRGVSAYSVKGSQLKFETIALTRMMCFGESQAKEYTDGLNRVSGIEWTAEVLKFKLQGGGTMFFTPAVKSARSPAGSATKKR
ncbi:MAG: META domain-containing protein [Burkholderiales bacterium]|jgi:heat shock protein HslJ|nr:META domain-containing protein [Burkholderiales bacterium]